MRVPGSGPGVGSGESLQSLSVVAATVKIAGVRYDLAMGRSRSISIKAHKRSAGHSKKKWRPGKICS